MTKLTANFHYFANAPNICRPNSGVEGPGRVEICVSFGGGYSGSEMNGTGLLRQAVGFCLRVLLLIR